MTESLSPRETTKRELLACIAQRNESGVFPTKHDVCVFKRGHRPPNQTRANWYRMIDDLIARGLVMDTGVSPNGYALRVTDEGHQALEETR